MTLFTIAMLTPQNTGLLLIVLLLLFGAKKLPELARGLGQAIREFSKAKNDIHDELLREPPADAQRQIPPQTTAQAQPAPGTEPVQQPKDTHA